MHEAEENNENPNEISLIPQKCIQYKNKMRRGCVVTRLKTVEKNESPELKYEVSFSVPDIVDHAKIP